jgi:hypothetical protein
MTHHRPANPANTSNFKYLIFEIPISVVSEEIPLDFYSRILGKRHCAFSRLIKRTTRNICGANTPQIEHAGKAVMISNLDCYRGKIFTAEKVSQTRRLLLWANPDPLWKRRTSPLETQHVVEASWSIATERDD